MFKKINNYFNRKKLLDFYFKFMRNRNLHSEGYFQSHQLELKLIEDIILYYDGKSTNPKDRLESLIQNPFKYEDYVNMLRNINQEPLTADLYYEEKLREIKFLYNWICYGEITGI